MLTIDIKGTIHDQFRLPAVSSLLKNGNLNMSYEEGFIRETDRIYVLIQVADRMHAFFLGFAFGTDEFEYHSKHFGQDHPGYRPKVVRKIDELLALIRID
jgi:hypothetical protein